MKTASNSQLLVLLVGILGVCVGTTSCKNAMLPIIDHTAYIVGRDLDQLKGDKSEWKMYPYDSIEIFESKLFRCRRFVNGISEPFLTNDSGDCNPGAEQDHEITFTVMKIYLKDGNLLYHMVTAKFGDRRLSSSRAIKKFINRLQNRSAFSDYLSLLSPKSGRGYINSLLEYTGYQAAGYSNDSLRSIAVTRKLITKTNWGLKSKLRTKIKRDDVAIRFEYLQVPADYAFQLKNFIISHPNKIGNDKPIIMEIERQTEFEDFIFTKKPAKHTGGSILLPAIDFKKADYTNPTVVGSIYSSAE